LCRDRPLYGRGRVNLDFHAIHHHGEEVPYTTVHHGHISKAGSAPVRWVLDETAKIPKRRPHFEATYESIRKRRGNAIATVAIVRRLLAQSFPFSKRSPTTRSPMANLIVAPGELELLHVLACQPNS
jgi:hypothetical protein